MVTKNHDDIDNINNEIEHEKIDTNNNEEINDQDGNSEYDSINDEILLDENEMGEGNTNIEEYREKMRRSGVIYLSNIPEGMTVNWLREKLKHYGVTRVFLNPDGKKKGKKRTYKEGWCEVSNKIMGKLCEYELNGEQIGGKKNISYREDIWTIQYLHKFKWSHLIEKNNYMKKLREQRMKAEISQARREANFIEDKFEQSKIINKKRKREEKQILEKEDDREGEDNDNSSSKVDDRFKSLMTITNNGEGKVNKFKQRKPIYKK